MVKDRKIKMKSKSAKNSNSKLAKHRRKAAIKAKRPIHKKFLLHPATVLVILLVGVLLLGWTYQGSAADYTVTAKIPADPLTEPAIITSPQNGNKFTQQPIDISGTCPYKSYIKLYRNDVFAGTTFCNPDGSFGMQIGLITGENRLQARVFNITDDEGPTSSLVTVFYELPATPGKPPVPAINNLQPFIISSDYSYRAYLINENIEWQIILSGGAKPYAVNIKWGDGNESNYVTSSAGALTIEHSYSKAGNFKIDINGVDNAGNKIYIQLYSIVVKDKNALITSQATNKPILQIDKTGNLLWLMWPAYATLLLMVFSFWLGEREQLLKTLKPQKRSR
jgi:hypothetical protein